MLRQHICPVCVPCARRQLEVDAPRGAQPPACLAASVCAADLFRARWRRDTTDAAMPIPCEIVLRCVAKYCILDASRALVLHWLPD